MQHRGEGKKTTGERRQALLALGGVTLLLAGCGGGSDEGAVYTLDGVRVKATVDKRGSYDIEVNGVDCELIVASDNRVGRLLITGVSNHVTVRDGVTLDLIDFAGNSNRVELPKGLKVRVKNSGSGNRVYER